MIVDRFGYTAAFLESAVAAGVALAALVIAMPETAPAGWSREADKMAKQD
jgi:hypothetical protein